MTVSTDENCCCTWVMYWRQSVVWPMRASPHRPLLNSRTARRLALSSRHLLRSNQLRRGGYLTKNGGGHGHSQAQHPEHGRRGHLRQTQTLPCKPFVRWDASSSSTRATTSRLWSATT